MGQGGYGPWALTLGGGDNGKDFAVAHKDPAGQARSLSGGGRARAVDY